MSISVACPGCGKRYRMKSAMAGRAVPCKACGATLNVPAAGGGVFEQSAGKSEVTRATVRTRKDQPVPIDAFIRGTELLLLSFLVATIAFFGGAFVRLQVFDAEGWAPAALGWLPLISSILALFAGIVWHRVASDLECREPATSAVILQAVLVAAALVNRFTRIGWLEGLASLCGWVFYILIVAVLRQAAFRIDRGDQRDSATFVVQMGVGVVVFSMAAVLLSMMVLLGLFAWVLQMAAVVCLICWLFTYSRLLVQLRSAAMEFRDRR